MSPGPNNVFALIKMFLWYLVDTSAMFQAEVHALNLGRSVIWANYLHFGRPSPVEAIASVAFTEIR